MKRETDTRTKQQVKLQEVLYFSNMWWKYPRCTVYLHLTALFTNKWRQVARIRICAFCGYQSSPWRDIYGFCNQENGHWNQAFSFSLDRHRYLAASHCYAKFKLDGWLRLGITHYLFSWTSPCMLVHRKTFSGWSWKLVPAGRKGSTQDTEKGSIEHCGGWHTGYVHLRLRI